MFNQARIRLTIWYVGIVMVITLMFSLAIYRTTTFELDRMAERQRNKWERQIAPFFEPLIDAEILSEIRRRIATNLGVINLTIWFITGGVGYYLAGKTLQPIADNMETQAQFISDASHELKTPITAMRTALEVNLREKKIRVEEIRRVLTENLGEVVRLQRLAEALLELSNKRKSPMSIVKLNEVIEGAIGEVKPLAIEKQIIIKHAKNINRKLRANPDDLKRVLVTILDNAIKYSDKGQDVGIRAKIAGRTIELIVSDKGIGIATKDLPWVTERFFRAEKSRTTNGYGLGLAIAKKIIEEHQGEIKFISELGKGTDVIISLPYSAKIQEYV